MGDGNRALRRFADTAWLADADQLLCNDCCSVKDSLEKAKDHEPNNVDSTIETIFEIPIGDSGDRQYRYHHTGSIANSISDIKPLAPITALEHDSNALEKLDMPARSTDSVQYSNNILQSQIELTFNLSNDTAIDSDFPRCSTKQHVEHPDKLNHASSDNHNSRVVSQKLRVIREVHPADLLSLLNTKGEVLTLRVVSRLMLLKCSVCSNVSCTFSILRWNFQYQTLYLTGRPLEF